MLYEECGVCFDFTAVGPNRSIDGDLSMTPDEYAAHARSLKAIDLEIIASTKTPSGQEAIAAKFESCLRKRRSQVRGPLRSLAALDERSMGKSQSTCSR